MVSKSEIILLFLIQFCYLYCNAVVKKAQEKHPYFDFERPKIMYYNESYLKNVQLNTWRGNRSDPIHYINLKFDLLIKLTNEDTYHHINVYQLLSNRYKPSFCNVKLRFCDGFDTLLLFLKEAYDRAAIANGSANLRCPFKLGSHEFKNARCNSRTVPPNFPFQEGRLFYNATNKKDLVLSFYMDFQIRFL